MGIVKIVFYLSIAFVVLAIYLRHTIDKEKQTTLLLKGLFKTVDMLSYFDSWLRHIDSNGLRRKGDALFANYVYNRINRSGIIVDIKIFNGVEVIMFDVLQHEKKRPAIVYIHGGGWGYMSPRLYSGITAEIARRLNTLVISVDYRKAPEHPYPAALDDVLSAVHYLFINADKFDVDRSRVAIMGDSAGGNLAVAVTYHMVAFQRQNSDAPVPKLLVPLCPVLQIADMNLPSLMENVNDFVLGKKQLLNAICYYAFGLLSRSDLLECMEVAGSNAHLDRETSTATESNLNWREYLSIEKSYPKSDVRNENNKFTQRFSQLAMDPGFSPLSALNNTQLSLLPPMFIFGASMDPLRDDARLLAARASAVGIVAVYEEVDSYHDPFLLSSLGLSAGIKSLDVLESVFKTYPIL